MLRRRGSISVVKKLFPPQFRTIPRTIKYVNYYVDSYKMSHLNKKINKKKNYDYDGDVENINFNRKDDFNVLKSFKKECAIKKFFLFFFEFFTKKHTKIPKNFSLIL